MPGWIALFYGLVIGSFVNVLVARLPAGGSIVRPGSRCPGCGHAVRWYDNLPVVSFALLRGRCRDCRAPISLRYPIIELLTAALFYAAQVRFGWSALLVFRDWPLLTILVAITFIDLEHRLIPDVLSLPGTALALLASPFTPEGWLPAVLGAAIGFGVFYGIATFYEKLTGRMGLGGGDVKLLALLGAFLGPSGVFATILISSIAGSLVGIVLALRAKEKDLLRTSIPYGPFLVLGGLYYYLLGDILWFQFTTPM